jgi:MFS family permease
MKSLWNPRKRILLWLACSTIFFEAFDVSIVNLAVPLIAKDLRIPLATAQWVQTIYLLSFGGFLLLGGRLCDHAGSRRVFLWGMLLFGGASVLGFASPLIAGPGGGIGWAGPVADQSLPGGVAERRPGWRHGFAGLLRRYRVPLPCSVAVIGPKAKKCLHLQPDLK